MNSSQINVYKVSYVNDFKIISKIKGAKFGVHWTKWELKVELKVFV